MRNITVLALALLLAVSFGLAFAEEGEVINQTCPVMGGEVNKDTPYKTEYNGQTIGFCCGGCIGAFNKNPEKYWATVEEELGIEEEASQLIECPACGAKFEPTE